MSAQAFSANYLYDPNGNRYQASITYLSTSIQSAVIPLDSVIKKDTLAQNTPVLPKDGWVNGPTDSLLSMTISIYPNPAHGILLVEISNVLTDILNKSDNTLRVWNIQGKEILLIQPVNYYNTVDMSAMPDGVYVIGVSINGNTKNYKVIKD